MKILVVNNNFSRDFGSGGKAGGAERYTLDIIVGLKDRGHQVSQSRDGSGLGKADVVYANNCFDTSLIRKLTGKPAVRFVHDHQLYCPGTPKYWFKSRCQCRINTSVKCLYYGWAEQCLSRNPAKAIPKVVNKAAEIRANQEFRKLVVASEFMKEMLVENGFDSGKVVVNPLFPYVGSSASSRSSASSSFSNVILFVGRVFKEKGVDYLVRACARLEQDYRLVVVGDGWDLVRCQQIAKDLGIGAKVEFVGSLPPKKVAVLYQQSVLVVVPSVWPEPFCLIGLEAMSYKKPVVAFDTGGISQWLKDGKNGCLVRHQDEKQLAQKISQLLTNPGRAKKLGQEGYNMVRSEFSFKRHLDQLENTLSEAVASK